MKKFIGIFTCLVIIICCTACGSKNVDTSNNNVSDTTTTDSIDATKTSITTQSTTTITTPASSTNTTKKTTTKATTSSTTQPSNNTQEDLTLPSDVGNEEEQPILGEDYGAFSYEGFFVNLVCDNDIVYAIFKSPNTIVAYNAATFELLYQRPLNGRPAEIQIDGNNLLISFPDLRSIKTFNKHTFSLVDSLSVPYDISSFCFDENHLYFSEDDQHCRVFCMNLTTKTTVKIGSTFYYPKLLLNKEKGLLYIGESHSTGSALYYFNTSDFTLHSKYQKNSYGVSNRQRTMCLVDDSVFWYGYRFGSDSAENIIGNYGDTSLYYADKNFVLTEGGVYETNSYQYFGDIEDAVYMAVTPNKYLIVVFKIYPGNIVVTIPY